MFRVARFYGPISKFYGFKVLGISIKHIYIYIYIYIKGVSNGSTKMTFTQICYDVH
jgi:hypothetical protein